jgi:hypothetical protein
VADKQPPPGPSPRGTPGPTPPSGGAGKPSPHQGVPAVGQRPGSVNPSVGGSSSGAKARPSDVDRKLLLRDVMDHAVKVHKETNKKGVIPNSGSGAVLASILCVPLLALCVYSVVVRPEWLWGPKAGPLPPVQQDANIRFSMFLLAQRIEAFKSARNQYPASLQELGESLPGVTYAKVNDNVFELRATEAGKPVVFRSDQPARAFLGNSFNVIQGSPR